MSKWFTVNGLSLNLHITKVDLNYLQNKSFHCFYKDKLIKEVIYIKLLGLEIDKHMNWKNHTVHILPK
jgi:predicted XRE-type DNA-binding protein